MNKTNWKTPFINFNTECIKKKYVILKIPRNFEIVPKFLGSTFQIYNGKTHTNLTIINEMIGHKFGEFISTRSKFIFKKKKAKKK